MQLVVGLFVMMAGDAEAREVVKQGPPARPPEAWYLLPRAAAGAPPEIACRAEVVVAPNGRPADARAVGCPAVFHDAIVASVRTWRWERRSKTSAERVQVPVRAPSLTPRARRGECMVGVRISGSSPRTLADVPARCSVGLGPVDAPPPAPSRRVTWCAVDVVVRSGEVDTIAAPQCAEGYASTAIAAVQSWTLPLDRDQQWRILLGYEPVRASFR